MRVSGRHVGDDEGRGHGGCHPSSPGRSRVWSQRLARVLGFGWAAALAVGVAAGCDSGSETGAECPPDSALTWEGFGRTFMDTYCVRCHSSYASQDRVRSDAFRIDMQAGAGPSAVNTAMPRSGVKPTVEEREALSTWLSCGAP